MCSTFGLREVDPIPLGADWDGGWLCGDVVLSAVADHARAAWSAKVRENLEVDGVRLARPVRSTDGRYVVSGWRADTFIVGSPEPRHDEVVSMSCRLHAATASLERPRFLAQPPVPPWAEVDVFVAADRAAWETVPLRIAKGVEQLETPTPDGRKSLELIAGLATLRKPVQSPDQLVHGDLFGTVLFSGSMAPESPTSRRIGDRLRGPLPSLWSTRSRGAVPTRHWSAGGKTFPSGRRCFYVR